MKFTYDYVGNSSLIDAITGPVHTVDLIWEPTRNVLEKRENQVAGNEVSGYQYRVNELGQRTGVTQTGSVFAPGQGIAWGYDALGQVTSASAPGTDADRAYQYDTIGNRVEAREEITAVTGTPNYTANTLNQYTAVGNRAPTHDDDGNLRLDGGVNKDNEPREYVWDAENRLISVKRVSDGAPIVSYLYDSQSRRIARTQGSATTLYLYDAWNCIAEYSIQNSTFKIQHSRLWGLDLSGTLQGAGGVGGMLCESQISNPQITNYYPTYDGNGNISEYLAQTGTPVARFEYDPFGNTVVNTDATNQFAYRFSTKPQDAATGLYYYGYRYYDPATGRWPSRDPIEEEGGINLYGFVGNDGVGAFDRFGLSVSINVGLKTKTIYIPGGLFLEGDITFGGSITITGEKQEECCPGGGSAESVTGTAQATINAEFGLMFGKRFNKQIGSWGAMFQVGIRIYSGATLAGGGKAKYNGCNMQTEFNGEVNGIFYTGIEGGARGALQRRINGRLKDIGMLGATLYGQLSSSVSYNVDCEGGSCNFDRGLLTSSGTVGLRFGLGYFDFTVENTVNSDKVNLPSFRLGL